MPTATDARKKKAENIRTVSFYRGKAVKIWHSHIKRKKQEYKRNGFF
jgi:hypothetical protein